MVRFKAWRGRSAIVLAIIFVEINGKFVDRVYVREGLTEAKRLAKLWNRIFNH